MPRIFAAPQIVAGMRASALTDSLLMIAASRRRSPPMETTRRGRPDFLALRSREQLLPADNGRILLSSQKEEEWRG